MTRVCKHCGVEKPKHDFHKRSGYKDGIRPYCKTCRRKYELDNYHKNKDNRPYCYSTDRDRKLKYQYGISLAEYDVMLSRQGGCCAICGTSDTGKRKAFHVDHDHNTGRIRGLLCGNCNSGIGNLRDDVGLLNRAIQYLLANSKSVEVNDG
jgi:hypothetical protein